jgi:hypothetical protein
MAEKEPNRRAREPESPVESSPNPHAEQHTADKSLKTDHRDVTGKQNVAFTPSSKEGQLLPSVREGVEGPAFDDDSMFNNADPQIGPATGKRSPPDTRQERNAGTSTPAKDRKTA